MVFHVKNPAAVRDQNYTTLQARGVPLTWIIITLLLLAAVGPVFYFMPSRKDRRLAALRQQALLDGLSVEMVEVTNPNPTAQERVTAGGVVRKPVIACARYSLPMRRSVKHLPAWRWLRDPESTSPIAGWSVDAEYDNGADHPEQAAAVERATSVLPDDCIAVEVSDRFVGCYWLERAPAEPATVTGVAEALKALSLRRIELGNELLAPDDG